MKTTDRTTLIPQAHKAYTDAKAAGKTNPEAVVIAKAICPVNVHKLNLSWYADPRNPNHVTADPNYPVMDEDAKNAFVVKLRADDGLSWGYIAVICGETESRISTRWEIGSKLARTGQRTGKGGRFAFGDGRLYVGNHRGLGTETTPEELKQLRQDEATLKAYMEAAGEYKSSMKKKAAAAKRRLKSAGVI